MERLRTAGAELEYEVSGTGEPAVFIHGALIADTFRNLMTEPALASQYRLIHYHRRGYSGSTRAQGPVSIAQQAADCRALLRHLGVIRAHVVGHSYGGDVAIQLALDTPGVVHTLALLEPGLIVGESAQGYRKSLLHGVKRFREAGAADVVDEFLQARWPGPGCRETLDRLLPGALAQAVADADTWFEHEVSGQLCWRVDEAQAARISQPTLCILGGESEAHWPRFGETHRQLLTWLPRAEGFVLPGTTHFMLLQDPGGVADALAAFWARHRLPVEDA